MCNGRQKRKKKKRAHDTTATCCGQCVFGRALYCSFCFSFISIRVVCTAFICDDVLAIPSCRSFRINCTFVCVCLCTSFSSFITKTTQQKIEYYFISRFSLIRPRSACVCVCMSHTRRFVVFCLLFRSRIRFRIDGKKRSFSLD